MRRRNDAAVYNASYTATQCERRGMKERKGNQEINEIWSQQKLKRGERIQVNRGDVKRYQNDGSCDEQRGIEKDGWKEGGIDLGLYPNKALVRSHSSFALPFPYQRTV